MANNHNVQVGLLLQVANEIMNSLQQAGNKDSTAGRNRQGWETAPFPWCWLGGKECGFRARIAEQNAKL